ncbi:MAG: DsbA family oxidoreductase [Alphaproteobacteria bacterium]
MPTPQSPAPVRVDIVSDVICPWCLIGKRNLDAALAQRPDLPVEVHWRAFQLNPDMPREGMARADYLKAKFGDASGGGIYDRVRSVGRQAGIDFDFEAIARTPNTVAAHRLIALAADEGRQDAVVEGLFRAYFTQGRDIGDMDELAAVAAAAGLSAPTIARLATTDDYEAEVLAEDVIARQTGVSGVPCFIFDRAFAVSGAHPPETLVAAIERSLQARAAAAE